MKSFRITRIQPIPRLGTDRYSKPLDVTVTNGTITAIESTRGVGNGDFGADDANLMPGLWDSHIHFSLAALISQYTHFSHKAAKSEILAAVEDHLRHRPPRLVGYGFRSATWPAPPTAADPDAVTIVPVALMSRNLHSLWYNIPALGQAGAARRPTGFLTEKEAFAGIRHIMSQYLDLVEHAVRAAEPEAASRGLVGIVGFSFGWAVETWQQRTTSRSIGLWVEAATYPKRLDDLIAMEAGISDELVEDLRVDPFRIIIDGSIGNRITRCIAPYSNPLPGCPSGKPNHTRSELLVLLKRAREARLRAAIHAIGDAACHDALNVFEISGTRGSVEHVQCVAPADLPRFARLKLVAGIQPMHQLEDIGAVERVWPGVEDRTYPMSDLLHAGARLAFGSDAPMASLDPWETIETTCHRPYRADQTLAPLAVLRASTRTTPSVGQPANLVFTTGPGKVLLTMLGGRITFSH